MSKALKMQDPDPVKEGEDNRSHTQRIVRVMEPITLKARGIVGKVQWMAWGYLVAALVLTCVLFMPFSSVNVWMYAFATGMLLLLAIPSGILFLFHAGLQSVIALPARLLEKAGVGEASARSILQAVRSDSEQAPEKKGKVLGTLVELRSLVLDSRDMLFEYGALLRLANPFVLGIVGMAAVVGVGIVLAAFIALVVVVI